MVKQVSPLANPSALHSIFFSPVSLHEKLKAFQSRNESVTAVNIESPYHY